MIVRFEPTDGGTYTDYRPPSRPNASRLDILGHRRNGLNLRTDSIHFHGSRTYRDCCRLILFVPLQFDDRPESCPLTTGIFL